MGSYLVNQIVLKKYWYLYATSYPFSPTVLSALCCYIGLWVGFAVNEFSGVNDFLLIAAAGSFIYITVTHVLPELEIEKTGSDFSYPLKLFLFVTGAVSGWGAMFVLAIYEEELHDIFAWQTGLALA